MPKDSEEDTSNSEVSHKESPLYQLNLLEKEMSVEFSWVLTPPSKRKTSLFTKLFHRKNYSKCGFRGTGEL